MNLTKVETPYHRNIKIYGNTFSKDTQKIVLMRAAENVEIYSNYSSDGELLDNSYSDSFVFEDCRNIDLKL